MKYVITGTVPTPQHNPDFPYYQHHESTAPSREIYDIGESGRTVSVTTLSSRVADDLESVFEKVFDNVNRQEIEE